MTALHILGLPHTSTTSWWSTCAYTQKVRRFATMMFETGYDVYLYAGPDNEAKVTEHVPLVTHEEQNAWWPDWDRENEVWNGFDLDAEWWKTFNRRAIEAISQRAGKRDLIGIIAGRCQQPVADAFPGLIAMEWGVGYEGITSRFRCFESYAWMHHVYGRNGIADGAFFDTVVPNSYEPGEFFPQGEPEDYFLYMGRMIPRKGLAVVAEIAKHFRVITAGQGDQRVPGAVHVGPVRGRDRLELLQGAKALLAPTGYIEPFGGVVVEAMLCGTPAITTDWGAFPELIEPGVTGARCRMLTDFLAAAERIDEIDRKEVAQIAEQRWTTTGTAPAYGRWLNRLCALYRDGWYIQRRGEPWAP